MQYIVQGIWVEAERATKMRQVFLFLHQLMDKSATNSLANLPASFVDEMQKSNQTSLNRFIGAIMLGFLVCYGFMYGFWSQFDATVSRDNYAFSTYYSFSAVFVVIGFGLLSSYFRYNTVSGMAICLLIVSMTILISPLLQNFWFRVFISDFKSPQSPVNPTPQQSLLFNSLNSFYIHLNYLQMKMSILCSISQLTALASVLGRLSSMQIVLSSLIFNIFWSLSTFLCFSIQQSSPDVSVYDDYQINNVYVFGIMYAVLLNVFMEKVPSNENRFINNSKSSTLAYLGTFFLFMTFVMNSIFHVAKVNSQFRLYFWPEGSFCMLLALCASVLTTLAMSVLLNNRINVKDAIVAVISGGVMYGSIAGINFNMGAAIAIGAIAGVLAVVFIKFAHSGMNRQIIADSIGIYSIGFVAFIGVFVVAPITLIAINNNINVLASIPIAKADVVGWILIYVGISIGVGIGGGLINGLIVGFMKPIYPEFDDCALFSSDYGLFTKSKEGSYLQQGAPQSAVQINR